MAKFIPAVLVAMTIAFSCTDDKKEIAQSKLPGEADTADVRVDVDSTFQGCDSVFIATYHGTACCVSGPTVAKAGDTATYHYQINHADPQYNWEVREGDITIIKGQDKPTVTVQFGPNFTGGVMGNVGSGVKSGVRLSCSDRCIIRTP